MVRATGTLVLWLLALSAQAAVSTSVDKNPVLVGETLTLSIRVEGGGSGEPDLTALEEDFQILGRSSSSQFQIVNGRTQRSHEWQIRLRPLRSGELSIPALAVDGERSQPIRLRVQQPQREPGELPEAFIEFRIDKDRAHVREQLLLTSRLFVRGDLVSGSLSDPSSQRAVIEQVGEQRESQALRGNHRYRVIERRYAVFAEQSGTLQIAAPVFNGELATSAQRRSLFGFSGGTRAIHAAGEPVTVEIAPQPAGYGGAWLPAAQVRLEDTLSPPDGPYRAGDPLTRTITLRVDGQLHTQLPDLHIPAPPDTQSYTEAPQDQTLAHGDGLQAVRQYGVAVIPGRQGQLVLPELRLNWWDTQHDAVRTAVLPARTLQIQPAAARAPAPAPAPAAAPQAAAPIAPAAPAAPVWPWQVATVAGFAGWIGTLLMWWWRGRPRRRPPGRAVDPIRRRRLLQALAREDAPACRQALLQWARHEIGPLPGLLQLAEYADDPAFAAALQALDKAAFGPGGDFERAPLVRFVRDFRYPAAPENAPALAPLYPGNR